MGCDMQTLEVQADETMHDARCWDRTNARSMSQCIQCREWFKTKELATPVVHECSGLSTLSPFETCQHCLKRLSTEETTDHVCPARPGETRQLAQGAQCKIWVVNKKGTINKHINNCVGDNTAHEYSCLTCKTTFAKPKQKELHVSNGCAALHPEAVIFFNTLVCHRCWDEFASLPEYREHEELRHSENEKTPFRCKNCGRGFPTKHARDNIHMTVCGVQWQNRNKHACCRCGQAFSNQYKRNAHQRTCTPFRCQKCRKAFGVPPERDEHEEFCDANDSTFDLETLTETASAPLSVHERVLQNNLDLQREKGEQAHRPPNSFDGPPSEGSNARLEKILEEPTFMTGSSQDEPAIRIAQALQYHRHQRGGNTGLLYTNAGSSACEISPEHFLAMFSKAACETLSPMEIEELVSSLQYAHEIKSDSALLSQMVDQRTLRFYEEETSLTNDSRDRLAAPSGQPSAELGLLMHCQTKDGKVGDFWDEDNQTISALQRKGLSPDFAFCFDLHWRAGLPGRKHRGCPAKKWPAAARLLHENLTADLLGLLPFHLLLVSGSCPETFHRSITSTCTRIQFYVAPSVEINMALQVRPGTSCRITTYIPHPAHVFYNKSSSRDICMVLDSVLSFYLWLLNRDFHQGTFAELASEIPQGLPGGAPLHRLSKYRSEEKSSRRHLREEDYDREFWTWAGQFIGESPADVLGRGESVVDVVNDKLNYLRHKGCVLRSTPVKRSLINDAVTPNVLRLSEPNGTTLTF